MYERRALLYVVVTASVILPSVLAGGCIQLAAADADASPNTRAAEAKSKGTEVASRTLDTLVRGCVHREQRVRSACGQFVVNQRVETLSEPAPEFGVRDADLLCMWSFSEDQAREDVVEYAPLQRLRGNLPHPVVESEGWGGARGYRYSSSRADHMDVHDDPDKLMFASHVEPFLGLDTPASNHLPLSWFIVQKNVLAERRDTVDGVDCWVVRREAHLDANLIVQRWWIAVDRDYLVMRYERGPLRPEGTMRLWEVETASRVAEFDTGAGTDSMWFATERHHVSNMYGGPDASTPSRVLRTAFRILSLQLNPGVDDIVFAPEPDPGMEVWGP